MLCYPCSPQLEDLAQPSFHSINLDNVRNSLRKTSATFGGKGNFAGVGTIASKINVTPKVSYCQKNCSTLYCNLTAVINLTYVIMGKLTPLGVPFILLAMVQFSIKGKRIIIISKLLTVGRKSFRDIIKTTLSVLIKE